MDALFADFSHATTLPFGVILGRLLMATALGAVIGFEREWRHHPAGLRTHILVSLAAATFSVIGLEIVHTRQFAGDPIRFDPLRLIEAVTAGIAFLAAGTIIFARGRVQGLTTGAGMWLAGAIGLASGLGIWQVAVLGTVLALVVLVLMSGLSVAVSGKKNGGPDDDAAPGKTGDGG